MIDARPPLPEPLERMSADDLLDALYAIDPESDAAGLAAAAAVAAVTRELALGFDGGNIRI